MDESSERIFWDHVNRDPLNYYFFIFDLKQRRDQTKIMLAMEEENIQGLMLVYRDQVVQLRGNREAVKLLLDSLSLEKVEMQAPLDCEDLVLSKYRPKLREEMMLMYLKRGEEDIQISTDPVRLGVEDAEQILELMRRADPTWWGDIQMEFAQKTLKEAVCFGIKQDSKLVSLGITRLMSFGSNISAVATHEQYRNRGYATSIVSTLVEEILKFSSTALIHVISDNTPAVHAYSKVGFKPYRTYLSIRN
jgi:ribosomal protein S18 acetylase RimI-like enzyme